MALMTRSFTWLRAFGDFSAARPNEFHLLRTRRIEAFYRSSGQNKCVAPFQEATHQLGINLVCRFYACFDAFMRRRIAPASPMMPVPSRTRLEGSGVAAPLYPRNS